MFMEPNTSNSEAAFNDPRNDRHQASPQFSFPSLPAIVSLATPQTPAPSSHRLLS